MLAVLFHDAVLLFQRKRSHWNSQQLPRQQQII